MSSIGNKEIFSKNLRYYIERSGKDRRELAEIWGFPYSTVTEWVNGKKYPRIDRIEIMADYFGILKSDLIEDQKERLFVNEEIDERNKRLAAIYKIMLRDPTLLDMVERLAYMDSDQRASYQQIMDLLDKK